MHITDDGPAAIDASACTASAASVASTALPRLDEGRRPLQTAAVNITIHIGLEKTGTTSIQGFLDENRAALRDKGVLFPKAPGDMNQVLLAAAAMSADINVRALAIARLGSDFATKLVNDLQSEIDEAKLPRLLLSNEHCSSRLRTVEEVSRLKQILDRFGKVDRIIVYLRRQDEFLLSTYSTTVKGGDSRPFRFPSKAKMRRRYDYRLLLELWAEVFGRDTLLPRRFEPSAWIAGDLLTDFCAAADLDLSDRTARARNISLSAEGLELLRLLNREAGGTRDGRVVRAVAAVTPGPRLSLSSSARRGFIANFEESNRWISRTFFGGAPLFEPVPDGLENRGLPKLGPDRVEALRAAVREAVGQRETASRP